MKLLLVCLLAISATACERLESAGQKSRPRVSTPPRQQPDFERTITIEFDAPANFAAKDASGRFAISAFQVGFFDGERIVRAIEVPRGSVDVSGDSIRLKVPLAPVTSPKDSSVAIKVRPLSAGPLGEWSRSAGSVTLPVAERDRPGRPSGAAAGQNRKEQRERREQREPRGSKSPRLTPADVEQHAALEAALKEVLGGMSVDDAVGSFAKLHDLAVAVALSSKLHLPFPDLCRAVAASPRRSIDEGLRAVRPSLDTATEIRAVRDEVRKLVGR